MACRKRVVSRRVSARQLAVDEEPEAFLKGERRDVRHLELLDERVIHTGKFQRLEFVEV